MCRVSVNKGHDHVCGARLHWLVSQSASSAFLIGSCIPAPEIRLAAELVCTHSEVEAIAVGWQSQHFVLTQLD